MRFENLETAIADPTRSFAARLTQLCQTLGFDDASYAHVNTSLGIISGFATYPSSWMSTYVSRALFEEDPIIIHGPAFAEPVDWAEFQHDPRYRNFFNLFEKHGLGSNGLTVPLTSLEEEPGLLSVVKNCSPKEWGNLIRQTLPELRRNARDIHLMALNLAPVKVGSREADPKEATMRQGLDANPHVGIRPDTNNRRMLCPDAGVKAMILAGPRYSPCEPERSLKRGRDIVQANRGRLWVCEK